MKNSKDLILQIATFLLIVLWVYTGTSKLFNFNDFRVQLARQAFPRWFDSLLLLTLPVTELIVGILLLFTKTKTAGLYLSAILMIAFTTYVGLVLLHFFGEVPCSCGGVIRTMGWTIHFYFNLFFLTLTLVSIIIINKKRRTAN